MTLENLLCGCPTEQAHHGNYCPYFVLCVEWKRSLVIFGVWFYIGYILSSLALPWR